MKTRADLKRRIYGIRALPTLPVIAQKVLRLADDEAAAEKLSAMISSDQALTARVLSLANSAYYGHRAKIGTIRQAVVLIGVDMLKQLSLSAIVCATMGRGPERVHFWKHALGTATASSWIAKRTQVYDSDVCFMAGLLHDVGKTVINTHFPDDSALDHTEVGAWIAERWQLPQDLINAIAFHHSLAPEHLAQPAVACVHAGDVCANLVLSGEEAKIAPEVLGALRLSEAELLTIADGLRNQQAAINDFLM